MLALTITLAVLRILTGALLALSAYGKFAQRYPLAVRDVAAYKITGPHATETVAIILAPAEMFLAGCLVLGAGLPATELLAAGLFLGFAAVAYSAIRRGIATDCGCFGSVMRQKVGVPLLVRNLVIAVILVADALVTPKQLVWVQAQIEVLAILGALALVGIVWRISQRARDVKEAATGS